MHRIHKVEEVQNKKKMTLLKIQQLTSSLW